MEITGLSVPVVIQFVAALAAVIAAGFVFDTVWASVLVAALFSFLVGEALERR